MRAQNPPEWREPVFARVSSLFSHTTRSRLHITSHRVGGCTVVRLEGQLVLGPERAQFAEKTREILALMNPAGLVADLEGLSRLDSAGLGEFALLAAMTEKPGTRVAFARPTAAIKQLLQSARICTVGPVFDDFLEALDYVIGK